MVSHTPLRPAKYCLCWEAENTYIIAKERLTLDDIQSSLRLNIKVFDIDQYPLFCVIDVPQFNQIHKKVGLLCTIS